MDWIGKHEIEGRRRVPQQARSRRRYEAILDAASELFADHGFDATTMETIAERAETSIGSVYQFFAHKEAIYEAMVERLLGREELVFAAFNVAEVDLDDWEAALDAMIDGFAALSQTDPGYRAMLSSPLLYGRVEARAEDQTEHIVRVGVELLGELAPHLSKRRRRTVALTAAEVVTGLLFASQRFEARTAKLVLGEAKHVVRAYVRAAIEASD
ncbi:Transcriptional Regulator, TetR family protein [Plesiocystis pacifica SIR-1]|uniref:Transcriptional Regulator, TetR family protein n=1 Tax=Plesiocystis pacifica SIR-1 TaxID=391625 RepID=A6GGL0_9BACT|nr:TetR/AcrR family transcriptional regulator [Plesiocystis pacifica]EDM74970.1 Transcriptional Regulator, TetR family protein [Plesiocystis pacifica SIR-1]